MTTTTVPSPGLFARGLARVDAAFDRIYSSRYNPLLQSGPIAVAMLVVLIVTGLYLLIFYRIGDPYGSTARIVDQAWAGRWIRSLSELPESKVQLLDVAPRQLIEIAGVILALE